MINIYLEISRNVSSVSPLLFSSDFVNHLIRLSKKTTTRMYVCKNRSAFEKLFTQDSTCRSRKYIGRTVVFNLFVNKAYSVLHIIFIQHAKH